MAGPSYASNAAREARASVADANEGNEDAELRSEFPKYKGGGFYELSDGSSVQGKEEAIEAEAAL